MVDWEENMNPMKLRNKHMIYYPVTIALIIFTYDDVVDRAISTALITEFSFEMKTESALMTNKDSNYFASSSNARSNISKYDA